MIRILLIMMLTVQPVIAGQIVLCDPDGTYRGQFTTGRGNRDYDRPNALVWSSPPHPNRPLFALPDPNIPAKFRKCVDTNADGKLDSVVEMTKAEKDTAILANAILSSTTIRSSATDDVKRFDSRGVGLRAVLLTVLNELNILRVNNGLSERTTAQIKILVKEKINDGSAD